MAGYANGHNYHHSSNNSSSSHPMQYSNHVSSHAPQAPYYAWGPSQPPDFNPGDDTQSLNHRQFQNNAGSTINPGYGAMNGQSLQSSRGFSANCEANAASAMQPQLDPTSGYQNRYQQANHTNPPAPYNPSQYSQPPSQSRAQPLHDSLGYSSPTASYIPSGYQAYNPAAYQSMSNQSFTPQTYGSPPDYPDYPDYEGHAQAYRSSQAPPVPPRPPRHHGQSFNSPNNSYGNVSDHVYAGDSSVPQPTTISSNQMSSGSPPAPPAPPHDPLLSGYTPNQPDAHHHAPPYTQQSLGFAGIPSSQTFSYSPARYSSYDQQLQTPTYADYTPVAHQHVSGRPPTSSANDYQLPPPVPARADTIGRHPQQRPLPGPPAEDESPELAYDDRNGTYHGAFRRQEDSACDELMREVDAAIQEGSSRSSPQRTSPQTFTAESHGNIEQPLGQSTPISTSPRLALSPDERPTHMHGDFQPAGEQYINYAAFSDDSDAEAAAGVAAMQAAEEQEAEEARHRNHSGRPAQYSESVQRREQGIFGDGNYTNIDMSLVSGGDYGTTLSYGDEPQSDYAVAEAMSHQDRPSQYLERRAGGSNRSSGPSSDGRSSLASGYESIPGQDAIHPFPPFRHVDVARVDHGGTGGLTEPSPHPRRLSFDDGDEVNMVDSEASQTYESVSSVRESMQDLSFFTPGMTSQRPLPPAPSTADSTRIPHLIPAGTYSSTPVSRPDSDSLINPADLSKYARCVLNDSPVPRSTSLASGRSNPKAEQPIRSKTDADRIRLMKQQFAGKPDSEVYESSGPAENLPEIPVLRKRFNPAKLTKEQLGKCSEPWAISSVLGWVRELAEEETDLKEQNVVEAIITLFTFAVPTMNMADAESLSAQVVSEMMATGVLVKEEEWVKLGSGTISGVLFQLTKKGCYSARLHEHEISGKCYSHQCMRTLRKVDLSLPIESEKDNEDWATFYQLKKEDCAGREKKEIERQNVLHEIVSTEVGYIESLDVLRIIYRDTLLNSQPLIIQPKYLAAFCRETFGKVDDIKRVNEEHLLAQIKYRQKEQGPWITGFSDIFREWIRKAKLIYIDYAAGFPHADFRMRKEASKNIVFRQFLNHARDHRRSNRLSWDTYLKAPITRLQRYSLLLETVLKATTKDSEEKLKLQFAIDEIKAATHECDVKVAEKKREIELLDLKDKLWLRKGMEKEVKLNLTFLGREIIQRGDLLRASSKGFQWVDTHAILFDHYLVLAKAVTRRDSISEKHGYDVSKVPIPMDLIMLDSTNEEPVIKGSVKAIGGIGTIAATQRSAPDARTGRTSSTLSGGSAPTATVVSSGSSSKDSSSVNKTIGSATVVETNSKDDKLLYPFRVKHLGKSEVYTLYAQNKPNRDEWCQAITSAKTHHAAALFKQNAEPFRLRVLADAAFGYDSAGGSARGTVTGGTPLDRALKEIEQKYAGRSRPSPICRAVVNCATTFNHPPGRLMCAIGTDYGVYFSEYDNPRGWSRAIQMSRVSQVAVFEEFNLFLLISDKALIAYHLDAVCPQSGVAPPPSDASTRRAPQKLSGNKDVGFFATGRMKDRALVFYKKKDGISSTFKVLEPILQKAGSTRSRFLPTSARRGQTDFFREFDEFYIPTECYSINLFHSSLAVATARGVEVLTLDKKQPWSVPTLYQADAQAQLSSIAARIKDLKPLGMFRLSETEFLVAFEECAVYVDKHGDVSRGVVMEFVGRATSACLYGQYLILIVNDFVEIRNAMNGSLKQVIAGRDVRMLDDGGGSNNKSVPNGGLGGGTNGLGMQGYGMAPRTVKVSMQHPEYDRNVLILELLQNEGTKDS